MRLLKLNERHQISDKDEHIFKFTDAQRIFVEEYLSNGMESTSAAREAVKMTSPDVYEKKKDDRRYFSYRATNFLKSNTVSAYLEKHMNKDSKLSTVKDIVAVVSSILHDENEETKNRLKAAELLLKHHDGFRKHNESRSSKSIVLNQVSSLSDKEIEAELMRRLNNSPSEQKEFFQQYSDDDDIVDVEEIDE